MFYTLYLESNKYQTALKALSKYNRLAYKYILFTVIPELKDGHLIGNKLDDITYSIDLPCDSLFEYVHGKIQLKYHINTKDNQIIIDTIEPYNLLNQMYRKLITVKDGIPVTSKQDLFRLEFVKARERLK